MTIIAMVTSISSSILVPPRLLPIQEFNGIMVWDELRLYAGDAWVLAER